MISGQGNVNNRREGYMEGQLIAATEPGFQPRYGLGWDEYLTVMGVRSAGQGVAEFERERARLRRKLEGELALVRREIARRADDARRAEAN